MASSARELSSQMIDASAVASHRFLYVVGGISTSDMAKECLPGLLDFVGDTYPDKDFSKDVVGTANRISQNIIDLGDQNAKEQLSTIGRKTTSMFENIHATLKKMAADTETTVGKIVGNFMKGQNSFATDEDYDETEPVLRMRAVSLQSRPTY